MKTNDSFEKTEIASLRKIAILTGKLARIGGSELVAIEVATYYANTGHDVTIRARRCTKRMRNLIGDNIRIAEKPIEITDYDFVWSQHGSYLENISDPQKLPAWDGVLATVHLSHITPLEIFDHPLAHKYIGARVFHAEISMDALEGPNVQRDEVFLFRNAAPAKFHLHPTTKPRNLKKILIVSNHVPAEVEAAAKLLNSRGIEVETLGKRHKAKLIEPEDLEATDAVISIGKTIQYALVTGTPVYCYDHFGGPGWLDEENFESAEYSNFNGRCCGTKRTPEEICNDIVQGFDASLSFAFEKRDYFSNRYNLEKYLDEILKNAKTHRIRDEAACHEIGGASAMSMIHSKTRRKFVHFRTLSNVLLVLVLILLTINARLFFGT